MTNAKMCHDDHASSVHVMTVLLTTCIVMNGRVFSHAWTVSRLSALADASHEAVGKMQRRVTKHKVLNTFMKMNSHPYCQIKKRHVPWSISYSFVVMWFRTFLMPCTATPWTHYKVPKQYTSKRQIINWHLINPCSCAALSAVTLFEWGRSTLGRSSSGRG